MQFVELDGICTAFRDSGPRTACAVLLAHPLGMNQSVWDDVVARLDNEFRCIRWDLPGHGCSAPAQHALTVADLAHQALVLLDALHIKRTHFVGTSIGGVLGQALLLTAPARLDQVVLTNTGAVMGTTEGWRERAAHVRGIGLPALAEQLVQRWFGPRFKVERAAEVQGWAAHLARCDGESYARLCELLAEADFRGQLANIRAHVHLLGGTDDVAAPPATLATLGCELTGAAVKTLDDVGHVPAVEAPAAFTQWLRSVLSNASAPGPAAYEQGLAMRRRVLGAAHVARALRSVTTLDAPFQNLITRLAWGELWSNTDLSQRDRSLITLAVLAALGRDDELELHLDAAKGIGVSEAELRQALMHVAIYAGVPAANHAFKLAREHGWGTPRDSGGTP